MNIIMLGHKRIPGREGGVEVVVEELAARMVKRGHQVTCYNRKGHHTSGSTFDTGSIDSYRGIRIKSVYYDFISAMLHYADKKESRQKVLLEYLKSNPGVKASDVVKFVSDQPDFSEDAAYMQGAL